MIQASDRGKDLALAGLGMATLVLPTGMWAAEHETGPVRIPNFLLIIADDMGYSDAGCYGGEIRTPHLDRLAANGLRFTSLYNSGRCWPSRGSILTGYYAQQIRRDTFGGVFGGTYGRRPAWAPLLPELLRPLGYRSYHSGKWHIDGKPLDQGFDRSFEYTDGDHHFVPAARLARMEPPLQAVESEGYYAATAVADNAIRHLRGHAEHDAGKPFFSYVAFNEPHFAIQAPQQDIDRYRDTYRDGWDRMRDGRWKRMQENGLIHCALSRLEADVFLHQNLTPAEAFTRIGAEEVTAAVPWDTLAVGQQRFQATKMAIHAAMIDRMDQEIGRILDQLKAMNAYDNTVVMFLSDNGASAEQMIRGDGHDPAAPPGSARSYLCLGPGFSSLANTPFRLHKSWVHEGGIATPFIVHWPDGIAARGALRHDVGHIIDVVPTLMQLAGGTLPGQWRDVPVPRKPGVSLVPAFARDGSIHHDALWWWHEDHKALRAGGWKIVTRDKSGSPWELYDMTSDRCESVDLAGKHPDKVRELAERWEACAQESERMAKSDGGEIFRNGRKESSKDED